MDPLRLTGVPERDVDALAEWLAGADDVRLVVETSGSSGAPKRVVLSRAAVLASAEASARRLGGRGRWLLTLPSSYVAGVNVIVRSLLAGWRPEVRGDLPFRAGGGPAAGYVSMVPTQLHRWLEEPDGRVALGDFDAVLVGGGPIPAGLGERAAAMGVRVVATYGSAETCGGCVYDGVPLDGVGLALGERGRIRLSGPTLFDEYAGEPALTAEALVDGWFLTSDAGRLDDDGLLRVVGRLDDVVVSGGLNVPGPEVAARLREHPSVRAAEVLGVDDAEWGQRLVAFVVGDLALDAARDWVSATLPRAWAPRQVVALGELPVLDNGKVDRVRLRGLA